MSSKDELRAKRDFTGMLLMMNMLQRLDDSFDRVKDVDTPLKLSEIPDAAEIIKAFPELLQSIALFAGSEKTNVVLRQECQKLIKVLTKYSKIRPRLLKKRIGTVKQAMIEANGGHFVRWEMVAQTVTIRGLDKISIAPDTTIVDDSIEKGLRKIAKVMKKEE